MYASQTHQPSNGVMTLQKDVELGVDGVNGIAGQHSNSDAASDLPLDTVEDTIEAFSTPC